MTDMREEVEMVLGKPVLLEFTDPVRKMRTNLLLASVIAIAVIVFEVTIDPHSTIFGVQFSGLTDEKILKGLLAVNLYMLIHFSWCSWDGIQEWRLRVSGTRTAFITAGTFASGEADYPDDPRQSTLYHWWKNEAKRIPLINAALLKIDEQLSEISKALHLQLDRGPTPQDPQTVLLQTSVMAATQSLNELQSAVAHSQTLNSLRIPVSLEKFDSAYALFLRSENLRWLVVELGFPLVLAISGITLLLTGLGVL